nr:MAG TPA: hypothetical protein [Caudoviricetes sp.]
MSTFYYYCVFFINLYIYGHKRSAFLSSFDGT